MRKTKKVILYTISTITVMIGAYLISSIFYQRADENVNEMLASDIFSVEQDGLFYIIEPPQQTNSNQGIIFYPGAHVEPIAYLPLLQKISQMGLTCVLVKMPLNMPVFQADAADQVYPHMPEIDEWYICGHSFGGFIASSYAKNNSDKLQGLIILGSSPANEADIPTLVIYGTWDEKINIPKLAVLENSVEIIGGNHAGFGNYGEAIGDGEAEISREEQQQQTADIISDFVQSI